MPRHPLLLALLAACDPAAPPAPPAAAPVGPPAAEEAAGTPAEEDRPLDAPTQRIKELALAKDCATALAEATTLLQQSPANPDLLYWHARCLELSQRWPEAAVGYKAAIAVDPDFLGALHHLGVSLVMLRRCDEALPYLDHIVELQPTAGVSYYNRGHCRYFLKDLEGALADAEKGCSLGYEASCAVIDKIEKRQAWVKNLEKRNKDANPEALDAEK